jgi:hypothetical protein
MSTKTGQLQIIADERAAGNASAWFKDWGATARQANKIAYPCGPYGMLTSHRRITWLNSLDPG